MKKIVIDYLSDAHLDDECVVFVYSLKREIDSVELGFWFVDFGRVDGLSRLQPVLDCCLGAVDLFDSTRVHLGALPALGGSQSLLP